MRSGNEHRISNVIYGMYNASVGTERGSHLFSKYIKNFYYDVRYFVNSHIRMIFVFHTHICLEIVSVLKYSVSSCEMISMGPTIGMIKISMVFETLFVLFHNIDFL